MAAQRDDERDYMVQLIERIIHECPRRQPTSADERRASEILYSELAAQGLDVSSEGFKFSDNLYSNLALHFGIGTFATAISGVAPHVALPLHLLAGTSYLAESMRRAYILRRLLGFKDSQNIVAVAPASAALKLRIVINAHVDAAFSGLIFDPWVVRHLSGKELPKPLRFLRRSLAVATRAQFALAAIDLARIFLGPLTWPMRPIEHLINAPGAIACAAGLEAMLRNRIVAGANDDLSGAAALPILAARLLKDKPDNVELVFVATGCEEASLGGADALARAKRDTWDTRDTVFLSLDGITNGKLFYLEDEGEVVRIPAPLWMRQCISDVAASETRFKDVDAFCVPVGGSDAAAFLAHGYDAVCLACVDPELGSPRHYHQVTDTPDNLDLEQLMDSVDFAEQLVRKMVKFRLSRAD